jgi:xylose isomerase
VNFDAKRSEIPRIQRSFLCTYWWYGCFARALITADNILQKSDYRQIREQRYASFDSGSGKDFEEGRLTLEDLRRYAIVEGEPAITSGKQEYLENIINRFI